MSVLKNVNTAQCDEGKYEPSGCLAYRKTHLDQHHRISLLIRAAKCGRQLNELVVCFLCSRWD